jgi:predicted glycoside hydrolase/deacetylase ChbG (UPF0249 family)
LIEEVQSGAVASASRRRQLADDLQPFDLGIHLNLTQGRPLSPGYPLELLNDHGQFPGVGSVFRKLRARGSRFRGPVHIELQLQIERMLDYGIRPTHLNGHQYIELIPGVAELIPQLMTRYSIRVVRVARETHLIRTVLRQGWVGAFAVALVKRHFAGRFQRGAASGFAAPARFFGTAHAGLVTRTTLGWFLAAASPMGCTEIGLHPATGQDGTTNHDEWFDPLASTRPGELDWLCDPATADLISAQGLSLGRLCEVSLNS